jgi:hypothetical protein
MLTIWAVFALLGLLQIVAVASIPAGRRPAVALEVAKMSLLYLVISAVAWGFYVG